MENIAYPYLPIGREFKYVAADHPAMLAAKETAREQSLDKVMPTGSVIVRDGEIIGRGANGSEYHLTNDCERVRQSVPTGQGYELCEGCHPKNHSEPKAVADAREKGISTEGADLYLWGHWWACEPCWKVIMDAALRDVFLVEGSEKLFNKNHPDNVVGTQLA